MKIIPLVKTARLILFAALLLCPLAMLRSADEPAQKPAPPPRAALPQNIEKRDVTIFSDGVRMAGDLYFPKGLKPDEKRPAVVTALTDPTLSKRLGDQGLDIPARDRLTPEALGAFHKSEIEKWWPIIKAARLKPE